MPLQRRGIRGDVGIAPYARLPHLHLALALSFRASAHTGVGIRTPRPQARNPPTSLCEAAQCSHWVVRSEAKLRCHGEAVTVGEICHGSSAAYGAMWASPPTYRLPKAYAYPTRRTEPSAPTTGFPAANALSKPNQRPKAATYLCHFAAKARFDNRPNPRVGVSKEGGPQPSLSGRFKVGGFSRGKGNRNPFPLEWRSLDTFFRQGKKVSRRRQKEKTTKRQRAGQSPAPTPV